MNAKNVSEIVAANPTAFRAYCETNGVNYGDLAALRAAQKAFAKSITGEGPKTDSKRPRKVRTMGIFGVKDNGARTLLETVTGTVTECKATADTKVLAAQWTHGESFVAYSAALIDAL